MKMGEGLRKAIKKVHIASIGRMSVPENIDPKIAISKAIFKKLVLANLWSVLGH
jgi:hypothetical protein